MYSPATLPAQFPSMFVAAEFMLFRATLVSEDEPLEPHSLSYTAMLLHPAREAALYEA